MFDRSTCAKVRVADAHVDLAALTNLAALLRNVLNNQLGSARQALLWFHEHDLDPMARKEWDHAVVQELGCCDRRLAVLEFGESDRLPIPWQELSAPCPPRHHRRSVMTSAICFHPRSPTLLTRPGPISEPVEGGERGARSLVSL
jgi:hypothetical protein